LKGFPGTNFQLDERKTMFKLKILLNVIYD